MLHICNILSHQAQTAAILLVAFSLGITGIAAHVPGTQDKDPHKGDFCVDISRYEHIAVNETWKEVGTLETTGCPEDESNFETYGNSGIGGAMRISFGLLRAGMCWFNYM